MPLPEKGALADVEAWDELLLAGAPFLIFLSWMLDLEDRELAVDAFDVVLDFGAYLAQGFFSRSDSFHDRRRSRRDVLRKALS